MLCCVLLAAAATPFGAFLIGPSPLACCDGRIWLRPALLAFGLSLAAALAGWALLWLLLPGFSPFRPLCRVGALLAGAI
jgi:hypothetical protein